VEKDLISDTIPLVIIWFTTLVRFILEPLNFY